MPTCAVMYTSVTAADSISALSVTSSILHLVSQLLLESPNILSGGFWHIHKWMQFSLAFLILAFLLHYSLYAKYKLILIARILCLHNNNTSRGGQKLKNQTKHFLQICYAFYASASDKYRRRHYVFGLSVRDSVRPSVRVSRYASCCHDIWQTNVWTEFHHTLVDDDVTEAANELFRF